MHAQNGQSSLMPRGLVPLRGQVLLETAGSVQLLRRPECVSFLQLQTGFLVDIGQLDFALSFGTGFGTWLGSDDSLKEETYITDRGYIYPGLNFDIIEIYLKNEVSYFNVSYLRF